MKFFLKRGAKVVGPFDKSQIRSGLLSSELSATDQFSANNEGPWRPLSEFDASADKPPTPPSPSIDQDDDDDDFLQVVQNTKPKAGERKLNQPGRPIQSSLPNPKLPLLIAAGFVISLTSAVAAGLAVWSFSGGRRSPAPAVNAQTVQSVATQATPARSDEERQESASPQAEIDEPAIPVPKPAKKLPDNIDDAAEIVRVIEQIKSAKSAKEAFACCLKEDAEILSAITWDGADSILDFSEFPSAEALERARLDNETILVGYEEGGVKKDYTFSYSESGWRINYLKSWVAWKQLGEDWDVVVLLTRHRTPSIQLELEVWVANHTSTRIDAHVDARAVSHYLDSSKTTIYNIPGNEFRKGKTRWVKPGQDSAFVYNQALLVNLVIGCGVRPLERLFSKHLGVVFVLPDEDVEGGIVLDCKHKHEVVPKSKWDNLESFRQRMKGSLPRRSLDANVSTGKVPVLPGTD